ncbi:MAG: hypothetical protein ABSB74_07920 [Tepidisphaeraceae bacterium]
MSEPVPTISGPALNGGFRRRRLAKMIALAAIIFAGGGATGWGVAIFHRPPPPIFGEPPTPRVNDMVSRLREELLLSDDQAKQVKEIYQQRNDALQAIRERMGPQLKAEYDKLNEQMKQVLNAAQFQRWHERFEDVRSRMLPPPPPPRGPGRPPGPEGDFGPGRGPRQDGGFPPPGPGGGSPFGGPPHDAPPGGPPRGMPPP